jgi:hypothetical protein
LSQKLSQLSTHDNDTIASTTSQIENRKRKHSPTTTTTIATPDLITKKFRIWDNRSIEQEDDLDYWEKLNTQFDEIMTQNEIIQSSQITIEDLRNLTILKTKLATTQLSLKLWRTYLQLCTGQYEIKLTVKMTVHRRFLPIEVKDMIPMKLKTMPIYRTYDDHKLCELIIQEQLEQLEQIFKQDEKEYHSQQAILFNFNDHLIEPILEAFVQQYSLAPISMKMNLKLSLLEYDYYERLLERHYYQLNPTPVQVCSLFLLLNINLYVVFFLLFTLDRYN